MFGLRLSSAATSRFLRPATTSSTIRRSVSESSLSDAVRPPIRRSSARAFSAHRRAPSRSKLSAAARASRGRRACAAPGAARFRAPGASGPNSSGFASCGGSGLDGRRLERVDRPLVVPLRGEKESAAAIGERPERRVGVRRALVEQRAAAVSASGRSPTPMSASIPTEPASWARTSSSSVTLGEQRRDAAASSQLRRRRRARATRGRGSADGPHLAYPAPAATRRRSGISARAFSAPPRYASISARIIRQSGSLISRPVWRPSSSPRRRVARPQSHSPEATSILARNIRYEHDLGIRSRRRLGDQRQPQRARLFVVVGPAEQKRERHPRPSPTEPRRRPPARSRSRGRAGRAGCGRFARTSSSATVARLAASSCRVAELLGEREPRLGIATPLRLPPPAAACHASEPRMSTLARRSRRRARPARGAEPLGARNPSVCRSHAREAAEGLGSERAGLGRVRRRPRAARTPSPCRRHRCSARLPSIRRRSMLAGASAGVSATARSASSAATWAAPRPRAWVAAASRAARSPRRGRPPRSRDDGRAPRDRGPDPRGDGAADAFGAAASPRSRRARAVDA